MGKFLKIAEIYSAPNYVFIVNPRLEENPKLHEILKN